MSKPSAAEPVHSKPAATNAKKESSVKAERKNNEEPTRRSQSVPTVSSNQNEAIKSNRTNSEPSITVSATTSKKTKAKKNVRINCDNIKTLDVPADQEVPQDVWNVYSPVSYILKKEQRRLQKVQKFRAEEIRKCFNKLYVINNNDNTNSSHNRHKNSEGTNESGNDANNNNSGNVDSKGKQGALRVLTNEQLLEAGYGEQNVASVAFIMSLWPGMPVAKRPPMSVNTERAIEALFKGTQVCVFNESPDSPVRCLAALRLLRNYEADEGSIAIYNSSEPDVIDGYIPLAFLVSVARGLEEVEKTRYDSKSTGTVSCTTLPEKKKISVECKRALSLHCQAPQKFYVTFIMLNDRDFHNWRRVIDYFVLLNKAAAAIKRQRSV